MVGFVAGPENGGQAVEPRRAKYKRMYFYTSNRVAGTLWIGVNAYILYAFCYVVLWHHVRKHSRGASVALLVVFSSLNLYVWIAFVSIHLYGPGKITEAYRKPSLDDPDSAFLCDEHGYSFYCSECRAVKPNRAHHSMFVNRCVPVMDHLCPWIGNVVGQGNRKFFMQFVGTACAGSLLVLITLFIFQNRPAPHINGNSIALYVICGGAFAFTGSVFFQHVCYLLWNHTTLEHMQYRRYGGPYINMLMPNHTRQVVETTVNDVIIPKASPFDLGVWKNVCDVMGPIYTWLLPIREPIKEPMITERTLNRLCGDAIKKYSFTEKDEK